MLGVLGSTMPEETLSSKTGLDHNKTLLFSGEKKFGFDATVATKTAFCYN